MSTNMCELGPDGADCGAFATGRCSDCQRYACRHHASFSADRLLCEGCIHKRSVEMEQRRAQSLAAQQERQREEERVASAAADAAQQAWLALPEMSKSEVLGFLKGSTPLSASNPKHPHVAGKRLPVVDASTMYELLKAGNFFTRTAKRGWQRVLHTGFNKTATVWVIGQTTVSKTERGDTQKVREFLGIACKGGDLVVVSIGSYKNELWATDGPTSPGRWKGTPEELERARRYLQDRGDLQHLPMVFAWQE